MTVFAVLYWIWTASEVAVLLITRTRRGGGKVQDRGSLQLLWVTIFSCIWISLSNIPAFAPANFAAVSPAFAAWARPAALALLIVGIAIRWSAIYTLGRSFSVNVAIHATQTVKRTGLYRFMRHPSYTGLIVIFAAIGLYTRNGIDLAIMLIPTTAALLYRIRIEEAALTEAFGPDYLDYASKTKRLIPGVY